jgi:hypothetical protein
MPKKPKRHISPCCFFGVGVGAAGLDVSAGLSGGTQTEFLQNPDWHSADDEHVLSFRSRNWFLHPSKHESVLQFFLQSS